MEEQQRLYDLGINNDIYQIWRNSGDIGYVQLAMKVVTEAMYDLVLGDFPNMISAHYFFFGNMTDDPNLETDDSGNLYESLYPFWAKILGIDNGKLPDIVIKFRDGYVDRQDLEDVRNLCTVVKTI